MKIPVKLTKEEVTALYGKEAVGKFLTSDATKKEITDALRECGTVINFIPAPTKEQYELAIKTYPSVFKRMPKDFQTLQNSIDAVKGDMSNLESCTMVDPEILAAALDSTNLKTYEVKLITKYAERADNAPLLNEVNFPKYIRLFPEQYKSFCEKYGRARISGLMNRTDIVSLISMNPTNIINFEIPFNDPAWQHVAAKSPNMLFTFAEKCKLGPIPYELVLTAVLANPAVASLCDYDNYDHLTAVRSAIFANGNIIGYVPVKHLDKSMVLTAITENPRSVTLLPKEVMSHEIAEYAVLRDPNLISELTRYTFETSVYLSAIESNFDNVGYLNSAVLLQVLKAICPNLEEGDDTIIYQSMIDDDVLTMQATIYKNLKPKDEAEKFKWEKSIKASKYDPEALNLSEASPIIVPENDGGTGAGSF